MSSKSISLTGLIVLLAAISYQRYLKDLLWLTFGFSRVMQPIEDFPYAVVAFGTGTSSLARTCGLTTKGERFMLGVVTLTRALGGCRSRLAFLWLLSVHGRQTIT